jgi:hypothetical protein
MLASILRLTCLHFLEGPGNILAGCEWSIAQQAPVLFRHGVYPLLHHLWWVVALHEVEAQEIEVWEPDTSI